MFGWDPQNNFSYGLPFVFALNTKAENIGFSRSEGMSPICYDKDQDWAGVYCMACFFFFFARASV